MVINGQRIFLNEKMKTIEDGTTNITDIVGMLSFNSLIKGIKFYDHEEELTENFELATRILYPISNIGLENNVIFEGIINNLERRFRETQSAWIKAEIESYMSAVPCDACKGKRLSPESLAVTVGGMNISSFCDMSDLPLSADA